jgi:hypothetical protein
MLKGDRAAERWERRTRRRGVSSAAHGDDANAWADICEHLTAALHGRPIREIERRVGLSQSQRAAFYELVSSSLKVADKLASACLAETALTPPARMAIVRRSFCGSWCAFGPRVRRRVARTRVGRATLTGFRAKLQDFRNQSPN